jgi:hypothetical protein
MTAKYLTPHEVSTKGFETLVKELGPGTALQFIGPYESGRGDYTVERRRILSGLKLSDIRRKVALRRLKNGR